LGKNNWNEQDEKEFLKEHNRYTIVMCKKTLNLSKIKNKE